MNPTLIVGLAGLLTTLLGSCVAPFVARRLQLGLENRNTIRKAREQPYMDLVVAIEEFQIRVLRAPDRLRFVTEEFGARLATVELCRAKIDVLGSDGVRVWAYRCTMALKAISLCKPEALDHNRSKLHDARANLVTNVRIDLSTTPKEATASPEEDNGDAHDRWLASGVSDGATAERQRELSRVDDREIQPPEPDRYL